MERIKREFTRALRCATRQSYQNFAIWAALCLLFAMVCPAAVGQTFQHPGVLVSRAQLDFIKAQVNAHADPIYSAFLKAQNSRYGSTSPYTPQGPPSGGIIDCGSFSNPDIGCTSEDEDGTTAYTQALLYWITGNNAYAQNAITILNAYGHNLQGYTNSNGPLQAGWGGSKWARAAEIIRYSNAGWSAADAQAFGTMMNNAILPNIINGSGSNGNWELSMIEAMIGIAVYNNDANLYNHAVTFWHQRVPAYFYYFPIDGPNPVPPPRGSLNWNGQTVFNNTVNGVAQETCRDFGHTEFGIAATMAAAETAHIQGTDLFGSEKPRLEAALEFHAHYLLGNPVPSSVCSGRVTLASRPTFEIGYNNYHNRLGDALPDTLSWLNSGIRSQSLPVDHHMMVFETLTHGADAGISQPDFSLTASPATQTITAGASTSYTATVTPSNGFNGAVALSVTGLPSGATGTFNPTSISGGSGTSTLSISTTSSTAAGNYTLTITGTSGSLTHSSTVMLSVNAPPDFSLSATPSSATVTAGNGTTYSATVSPLNGFTGSVSFSVSGLPSGATGTFNPASVSGSGSSTLTINTTSTTAANTYTLTITGTSGSLTHSATVTLIVQAPPPPDFSLSATPSSQTVVVGSGTSYTASVSALNGFTGAVLFSVSGLPSGATGTFNPTSVSGSGSSTLSVSTSGSTPTGTYTLTITGTSGSLSHSATVTLVVNPQPVPDFSVSATPSSQTVIVSNGTTYTVSVAPINGFAGNVALSVSGLPAGATGSFNPTSVSGGSGSSTLTVSTSSSTPTGTSTLTITGTSGSVSHNASVTLVVNPVQPVCVTAGSSWQNNTLAATQTGTFTASFDATPSGSPINAVIGLSTNAAAAYTDLAAIARLNPTGDIDARNGGAYAAASTIPYSGGITYHFRMVINVPAHTYSVFVTAPGGSEQTVGSNFAFRSEQATASSLSWWNAYSGAGSDTVCNFAIPPSTDFTLGATPSSQTVTAGNSTSYTVNVGATGGFSGTVALSVNGAPAGATASLTPTSVTGSGSSTLNLTTSSSTPAGSYTLTVTGTSGSLNHSTSVTLTVNAAPVPDFALSATPSTQTITAGNGTSYTASVSPINGFTDTVALSVSGLPSGASGTFNPTSVSGGSGSSTLTVSTGTSTPAGSYTVTITGTSGSLSHSTSVTLTVNPVPVPDFSMSAAPGTQTVNPGNGTSYTATVSPINGFAGSVGLSVSGLPSGAAGSLNPTSISGGSGSSTLSVTTSSTTAPGTYTLTITGTGGSLTHSATVTLVVQSSCVTAASSWQNNALAATQTGTFTASFDATPSGSPINAVIGLSTNAAAAYTDLAAIARFNPSGDIDARNGGAYAAASTIPYSGGVSYHFRMVINVPAHTYSVFVTAPGGSEQTVGSNFAFRSEQATASSLSWWNAYSGAGSDTVCNFATQ